MAATTTPRNVWIYARSSGKSDKEDGRDGTGKITIQQQKADGQALATRLGLTVVGVSEDNQYSSRTYPAGTPEGVTDNDLDYGWYCEHRIGTKSRYLRHGLAEVMNNLPRIDTIVIRDMTRLCRPFKDSGLLGHLFQQFRKYNVNLLLHNGSTIDSSDATARILRNTMAGVEDLGTEDKYAGHIASIATKRNAGDMYRAIRCYGYQTHDRKVTSDIPKLEIVKAIFRLYNSDHSWGEIARWCQGQDSKRYWSRNVIAVTIRNPIYCGYHRNAQKELTPAKYMEGVYTPVSYADWQTAYTRIEDQRTGRVRETIECHPATGILKCGYCGGSMVLSGPPGFRRYHCLSVHSANSKSEGCRLSMMPELTPHRGVEMDMDELIARGVGIVDFLRPLAASAYLEHLRRVNGTEQQKAQLAALDAKESNLREKAANNTRLYVADTIDHRQYEDTAKALKVQLEAITIERAKLLTASAQYRLAEGIDWRMAMSGGLKPETLRRLLRAVLTRVEVYGYHVRLVWKDGTTALLARQVCGNRRTLPYPQVTWQEGSTTPPKVTYYYEYVQPATAYQSGNITIEVGGRPTKPQARGERAKLPWFQAMYNAPLPEGSPDRL